MKKSDIKVGGHYVATVSGKQTVVRIESVYFAGSGWWAVNIATNRDIRIKSAARLRRAVSPDALIIMHPHCLPA